VAPVDDTVQSNDVTLDLNGFSIPGINNFGAVSANNNSCNGVSC